MPVSPDVCQCSPSALYTITPSLPTATKRPPPQVMPSRLARVARCGNRCQRRPSRLCAMAPVPTATKRSLPQATPFQRPVLGVRERSQLSPSALLTIVEPPIATKRPPPQTTSVKSAAAGLKRASDQLLPSLLRTIVPRSPTATKSSPFDATLSRPIPVVPSGEAKPPPPRTNRHTTPASSGGGSARCASAGSHGVSSKRIPIPNPRRRCPYVMGHQGNRWSQSAPPYACYRVLPRRTYVRGLLAAHLAVRYSVRGTRMADQDQAVDTDNSGRRCWTRPWR